MIWTIYNALIAADKIKPYKNNIKFYEYPATGDVDNPYIVIDPLDAPMPSVYADNDWLADDYMYQIDVWSCDMQTTKDLANCIRKVLSDVGVRQYGGGGDEYDEGIYRDARRYRGKEMKDFSKL